MQRALLLSAALATVPSLAVGAGITSRFDLANGCFVLASVATGKFVIIDGAEGYRAGAESAGDGAAFYMKPTGLGTYLFHDPEGKLLAVDDALASTADDGGTAVVEAGNEIDGTADVVDFVHPLVPAGEAGNGIAAAVGGTGAEIRKLNGVAAVGRADAAGDPSEWALALDPQTGFTITSTANGQRLAVSPETGELLLANAASAGEAGRFTFVPRDGCLPFPEAEIGAIGEPFQGTNPDGTVFGFIDTHVHITANQRAGGRVIHGEPFDRFGIRRALADCAEDHGPNGTIDVTGNLLRSGSPAGMHDTSGWPTFGDWPVAGTLTHQQTYFAWLDRAWMAGLRLIVAQTVADEVLCQIEPLKTGACDETESIKLQIRNLYALQDYIDAQQGGPGKGWFRIVRDPTQARRVIQDGKLAVVIGVESSKLLGCGEFLDEPECTRNEIETRLNELFELGVRSVFVAHWVDNAFAGAGIEGPGTSTFLNVFNKIETGHYYRTEPCPEEEQGEEPLSIGHHFEGDDAITTLLNEAQFQVVPTYPPGRQCNARGLTDLGEYLIGRLMEKHVLIEGDHLSEKARNRVLEMAEANDYPLISSHTGTGGAWTASQLRRLYALGGLASPTKDTAPDLVAKILELKQFQSPDHFFGVGFGTDTGGFSALPGPRGDASANPLRYPFSSYDGAVTFTRQQSGERVYDLNSDGVAHYGLFADLVTDMQGQDNGADALTYFFRSAEAYLEMWEQAFE